MVRGDPQKRVCGADTAGGMGKEVGAGHKRVTEELCPGDQPWCQ